MSDAYIYGRVKRKSLQRQNRQRMLEFAWVQYQQVIELLRIFYNKSKISDFESGSKWSVYDT